MPSRRYRRRLWLGAAALTIALLGLAGWLSWRGATRHVDIPQVDVTTAEAAVRARVDEAVATVRRQPATAAAWGELGMVYDAHGFAEQAVSAYREAQRLDARDHRWPYLVALALRESDPAAALTSLRQAVDLGAAGVGVYWNYGNMLLEAGQLDEAGRMMNQAAQLAPGEPHVLTGLGRLAQLKGQDEAAVRLLEAAVALDPRLPEAHALLAQAYRRLGRPADAERAAGTARSYSKVDETSPADPIFQEVINHGASSRWFARRAEAAFQSGRLDEAERLARQALAADANNPSASINLGAIRQARGDVAGAIGLYRQALAINPGLVEANSNLGDALRRSGDLAGAEAALNQALSLVPQHVEATLNLALLRLQQGRAAEAVTLTDAAMTVAPGHVGVLNTAAQARLAAGQPEQAKELWQRSLAISKHQPDTWTSLAVALARAGGHAAAVARLREGLAANPGNVSLQAALGWELATASDPTVRDGREALSLAQSVTQRYPSAPQSLDLLAAAHAELGDFDTALATAQDALKHVPADAGAIVAEIRERSEGYRRRQPYRQAP